MARAKKPAPAAHDEQPADSTAEAAASDAAAEGGEQASEEAEAAPPAAVEQGNAAADQGVTAGAAPVPANPMPTDMEAFITHCERLKQPELVLVAVRHPDIREARHRDGTFSGFLMEPGPAPWARWNDGSTFPAAD